MSQVVQASCPKCKNVLRIPVQWLTQPMRCKHCQQIVQAKIKSGTAPQPTPNPKTTAGRRAGGWWKPFAVGLAALAIAGVVFAVFGPRLANQFKPLEHKQPETKQD